MRRWFCVPANMVAPRRSIPGPSAVLARAAAAFRSEERFGNHPELAGGGFQGLAIFDRLFLRFFFLLIVVYH